ncbi:hypothetical protein LKL35_29285 [Streptomyces sp. ET3-23]|uniref:hypothetical protein n=1 Tax=Streptomyces sp. ET3-23 TaxID=2885643 RepID=UPI001D1169B4|nr:hypothetical protein [Streptomyces sp. ET3-23]MCC2279493.1 hypothetical protein [Streptomyces sp. ET3-23]
MTDKTYTFAVGAEMHRDYIRAAVRGSLENHSSHNVWYGTEYVNAAVGMAREGGLSDAPAWELTKAQLVTLVRAIEFVRARVKYGQVVAGVPSSALDELVQLEERLNKKLREVWHDEGRWWMCGCKPLWT